MTTQNSCIWLSNISVIDHAYIDDRGNVVGGSFNPSFFVSGDIDPIEQVVVDFSSIKKQIKQIIDDKENGFDHKLWWMSKESNGTLTHLSDNIQVNTPTTIIDMPANAIKQISGFYDIHSIGYELEVYVKHELQKLYPRNNIRVTVYNNTTIHFPTLDQQNTVFRYVHGLKDSTSWGCQNIAHGHLSFIQLMPKTEKTMFVADCIADYLDDVIFINSKNISKESDEFITIEYTTERGKFKATYNKSKYQLIILDTETTVEHLIEYIANRFKVELNMCRATKLLVSEGLTKGSCIDL